MKLVALNSSRVAHANTLPSVTEVVPQLSLETIFRDYCRGVLHPELSTSGMYDPDDFNDEDMPEEYDDLTDISQLVPTPQHYSPKLDRNSAESPLESPPMPSHDGDAEQMKDEGSDEGAHRG